jgi:hypothetical protein
MEGWEEVEGDSFHQKIPMKWAIFELGGRTEAGIGKIFYVERFTQLKEHASII